MAGTAIRLSIKKDTLVSHHEEVSSRYQFHCREGPLLLVPQVELSILKHRPALY